VCDIQRLYGRANPELVIGNNHARVIQDKTEAEKFELDAPSVRQAVTLVRENFIFE
jgi:hypothetical protein